MKKFLSLCSVMALMLVMNFASIPGVFAEADEVNDQNEETEYTESFDDEDLVGEEDEDADALYDQFVAEQAASENESVPEIEEEDPVDPWEAEDAEMALQDEEQSEGEGEGEGEPEPEPEPDYKNGDPVTIDELSLYPRLGITRPEEYTYYKNSVGKVRVRFVISWTKEFGGAIAKSVADKEYKEWTKQGWEFTYTLKTTDGEAASEELSLDDFNKLEIVVPQDKAYYVEVKATNPELPEQDPVMGSSRNRKVQFKASVFPAKPTGVKAKVKDKKSNKVTITWKKAANATAYCVYRNNKNKISGKPIGWTKTNKLSFVDSKAPGGKRFYFVKAMCKPSTGGNSNVWVVSDASAGAKVKVPTFLTEGIRPIAWYATLRYTSKLNSDKSCKNAVDSIGKGVKVKVVGKNPKRIPRDGHPYSFQVQLIKDDKVVKSGWIKYGGIITVKGDVAYKKGKALDWTKDFKEYYVNLKGFSSKTKYLIWTSTYTQRVNLFQGKKGKWKLIKSWRCTSGKFYHPTALTYNRTIFKRQYTRTRPKITDPTKFYYYHYVSYFSGGDGFHTIVWDSQTHKLLRHVVKNCQPGTMGCIRMAVADAKYIYTKVPLHTKTVFR